LINEGKNVLYGNLETIRREHAGHAVMVRASGEIPRISSVESMETHNSSTKLILNAGSNPQDVLADLVAQDVNVEKFEIALPTLDEIFIQVVQE